MTDTTLLPDVDLNALFVENNLIIKETRTVKIQGLGYGSSPATVNALFDNILQVYTGEITTVDQPVPTSPTGNEVTLFAFPVGIDWKGSVGLEITALTGTVTISGVLSDHNLLEPVGATESFYSLVPNGNSWTDVTIDSEPQATSNFYVVNEGSTIKLTLNVPLGVYTPLNPAPAV